MRFAALPVGAAIAVAKPLCSNIFISLIRNLTPDLVRIPVFIVVIASFVTITCMVFEAFVPALYESLGIFLPLIVVNCIILGRAEVFASKNGVLMSISDAFGISAGFMVAVTLIAFIRQILGTGKLVVYGIEFFKLPGFADNPMAIFIMPAGAFLVIGLLLAFFRWTGVVKND